MADENGRRLPIKIVIPQEGDVFAKTGGGSARRIFGDVDREVRQSLLSQLSEVRSHFDSVLQAQDLPAVARVVLKDDSLAKSHRPRRLFTNDTCPVIGSQTFGQLLVSVDAPGLSRLENQIETGTTRDVEADISTVSRIEPFTAEDALGSIGATGIKAYIEKEAVDKLKLKLFRHGNTQADNAVLNAFLVLIKELGLEAAEQVAYASHLRVFRLRGVTAEAIPKLVGFVGTQSLSPFPQFGLFAQYIPTGTPDESSFPGPQPNVDYPVVGVIDSGTDPNNPFLAPWVVARDEEDVPASDQDNITAAS